MVEEAAPAFVRETSIQGTRNHAYARGLAVVQIIAAEKFDHCPVIVGKLKPFADSQRFAQFAAPSVYLSMSERQLTFQMRGKCCAARSNNVQKCTIYPSGQ